MITEEEEEPHPGVLMNALLGQARLTAPRAPLEPQAATLTACCASVRTLPPLLPQRQQAPRRPVQRGWRRTLVFACKLDLGESM